MLKTTILAGLAALGLGGAALAQGHGAAAVTDYRFSFEGPLGRLAEVAGLGVISYYGLARGFLTGKYRSEADLGKSPRGEGVRKYLEPRGFRILAALDAVAARHSAAPAEVALAWVMARPGIGAPIASATTAGQVDSLVRAVSLGLSDADMAELDSASARE